MFSVWLNVDSGLIIMTRPFDLIIHCNLMNWHNVFMLTFRPIRLLQVEVMGSLFHFGRVLVHRLHTFLAWRVVRLLVQLSTPTLYQVI
jgi:hypothetical protein